MVLESGIVEITLNFSKGLHHKDFRRMSLGKSMVSGRHEGAK
jgi:hypothetical protein